MTCKEIHEQITAYVDDRVDEQEYRNKVQQHIKYCPDCRAAYELELATKMVVRNRSQRATSPDGLRQAIASQVDSASREREREIAAARVAGEQEGWLDRFSEFFLSPVGVATAAVLVILSAYAVINGLGAPKGGVIIAGDTTRAGVTQTASGPVAENFFNKAAENFGAILDGKLTVQHATDDQKELDKYFRENGITYPVLYLPVRGELAGGVVSQHDRTRFAHIVYTDGETVFYFFEVPKSALQQGDVVYVTSDVLRQLDEGKTFWEEPGSNMRLAMFEKGDLVLAVVSNAPRPDMERLLATK